MTIFTCSSSVFFDLDIAERYGALMAKAKQSAHTPGVLDTMIAATAVANGIIVATLNKKEFLRLSVPVVEV